MAETNKTILELTSEVNELKRIVNNHITGVSNYHEPAAPFSSGVLDDEGYIELQMATGFMKKMISSAENPVNPLNLPPGLYSIANAVDNPSGDDAIIYYKVFQDGNTFADGSSKRKSILATRSWDGKMWYRTVYSDGSPSSGTNGWNVLTTWLKRSVVYDDKIGMAFTSQQKLDLGSLPKAKRVSMLWGKTENNIDLKHSRQSFTFYKDDIDLDYRMSSVLIDDIFKGIVHGKEFTFKSESGKLFLYGENGNAQADGPGKFLLKKVVVYSEP